MKLRYSFETIELDDEIVAVPVGRDSSNLSGILKLNKEGQEIISLLKEDTTEEEVIKSLSDKYDNKSQIETYVHSFIAYLSSHDLLV